MLEVGNIMIWRWSQWYSIEKMRSSVNRCSLSKDTGLEMELSSK